LLGVVVQINTSLKKSIMVLVRARIVKVESRKGYVEAEIVDPTKDSVHAQCEGLVVLN